MMALDHFSSRVPEAEAKFRAAAAVVAPVRAFAHPRRWPEGEELHTLVCRVGEPDSGNILMVISGTHGVEGYAGAAIETGLLEQVRSHPMARNTAVVLVHFLNPWGAAWNRREDENKPEKGQIFAPDVATSTLPPGRGRKACDGSRKRRSCHPG